MVRQMVRPMPMPFRESPLWLGAEGLPSKIDSSLSYGMPWPQSRIRTKAMPSLVETDKLTGLSGQPW